MFITELFSNMTHTIFLYGLIISLVLPIIGAYLIIKRYAFIVDVSGHAYMGLYIIVEGIIGKFSDLSSVVIAYLMSKSSLKESAQRSQTSLLSYYVFFTVLLLAVINLLKPQALDSIVFGDLFSANLYRVIMLGIISLIFFSFMYKYRKEILLESISSEMSYGIYGIKNIKNLVFLSLFLSLIIVFYAINIFGILLTVAIAILPFMTASLLNKNLKNTLIIMLFISLISYLFSFYISYNYDVTLAVAYSGTILILYLFFLFLNKIHHFLR